MSTVVHISVCQRRQRQSSDDGHPRWLRSTDSPRPLYFEAREQHDGTLLPDAAHRRRRPVRAANFGWLSPQPEPFAFQTQKCPRYPFESRARYRLGKRRSLDRGNVLRLPALGALGDVELHLLAFLQALKAASLNRGEMHENVFAIFTADETIAFGALNHFTVPCSAMDVPILVS